MPLVQTSPPPLVWPSTRGAPVTFAFSIDVLNAASVKLSMYAVTQPSRALRALGAAEARTAEARRAAKLSIFAEGKEIVKSD